MCCALRPLSLPARPVHAPPAAAAPHPTIRTHPAPPHPPAGLLGFPPKDLQHRFLCTFKPVFYIRQRDYSKARPPAAAMHKHA